MLINDANGDDLRGAFTGAVFGRRSAYSASSTKFRSN